MADDWTHSTCTASVDRMTYKPECVTQRNISAKCIMQRTGS